MKLIAIIGGSSGIGQAAVSRISKQSRTVNMSRTPAADTENILMDACDHASVKNAFIELRKIGIPDAMVYCAGYVEPQGILEMTSEDWIKTIDINLTGAFYCTQEFARMTKSIGGKIIYIASTAGMRAQPGWSAYAASKAGLINFALTMSEELKDYGIRVYCIAPGRCATPLRRILAPNEDQTTIMQPEEVASFVEYLAMDDNILNGQVIIVKKQAHPIT